MTEETAQREDTMIYRAPTPESTDVQDIWGKMLEVKIVDAPEVAALLAEGWVTSPLHIDHPPKAEERAGFVPNNAASDALAAAEKLIAELTKERDDAVEGHKRVADQAQVLLDRKAEWLEERAKLVENLNAAEDLANEESKAKEAALARIAELEAPPKLTAKTKPA